MIDWSTIGVSLAFLVMFLTFVSLMNSSTSGWAWMIWGFVFSSIRYVLSFGRSNKPRWGKAQDS